MMPGLGRRWSPDERDTGYLLRTLVPLGKVQRRNRHWPFFAKPIDQGNTGTCVEHGWRHWGMAAASISGGWMPRRWSGIWGWSNDRRD